MKCSLCNKKKQFFTSRVGSDRAFCDDCLTNHGDTLFEELGLKLIKETKPLPTKIKRDTGEKLWTIL